MSFFKATQKNLSRDEFEEILDNENCKTANDVTKMIYGIDDDFYRFTDYEIKHTSISDDDGMTFFQRLNCLWVWPVFIIIIPFRFLLFGNFRVNEDSKFGRILIFLTGEFN